MLKLLKKETHTPQTERIYKVPWVIRTPNPFIGLRKMESLN